MKTAWQTRIAYLIALAAAGVLVVAAFSKAADPALFAEQITAHRVTPPAWSPLLAYGFIAAELVLGAALIAFVAPRVAFSLNILLMLGFIGVTAWAWAHGSIKECGCFGRLLDRGPRDVIIEDAIVIAASIVGFRLAKPARTRSGQWTLFAALLVPAIALTGFGGTLPIDGIVVGIRPGTNLTDMAIAGLPTGIDEGSVLLALVGPDCAPCDDGTPRLKAIVAEKIVPSVIAACPGDAAEAQRWRLEHLPNFPVGYAPARVLRQYYRRLPVTILLERGIVQHVWWNRVPAPAEVKSAL
jgi:hypothetical protein